MTNPFSAYPQMLKVSDIMYVLQYGKSSVYAMLKEAELTPGIVIRNGSDSRGIRVHRDNFFRWYLERSGMSLEVIGA